MARCQLESPAPGAPLDAGLHRLTGWVWSDDDIPFVDIRARKGGQLFPGVLGLPRPDLALHFQTGRPVELAGFEIAVPLPPGPAELIIEALHISGRWQSLHRAAWTVAGGQPPPATAPVAPWRWHDFCRGLDLLLRLHWKHPEAGWAGLAGELLETIPSPRELRTPTAPFTGFVEEPAIVSSVRFGRIPLIGYVFSRGSPIVRMWAGVDLQVLQPLDYGRPTPAIGTHYPETPAAAACGYQGFIDIPAQLPNPISLRVYAETSDGAWHLLHVQHVRRHDAEIEKHTASVGPEAFTAACEAWRNALTGRGIPVVEDADYQTGLARLGAQHTRPARPKSREPAPVCSAPPASRAPGRALLVTHNLNHEGAPLFLLDYAADLVAAGTKITLLSPSDGPLRGNFTALGIAIRIVDLPPLLNAETEEALENAMRKLAEMPEFGDCDLVVANTFTTFWAVHAAHKNGRPVVLYVHESTPPIRFYPVQTPSVVMEKVAEAFRLAAAVVFTTAATRSYHLGYGRTDNHYIIPGWIDVHRLDTWRNRQTREELRRRFSLRPDEWLVTHIGTISDRKGQHALARAIDLFWRRQPALAARTRFIFLGGRDSIFDTWLRQLIATMRRPNIEIHPETSDYLPYYVAADLTVCPSYEESSPRVVLEAMACETPLLAAEVQGIPELVRPTLEATLVRPGDTAAWADALGTLLLAPAIGRELAARARARVAAEFAAPRILPRHRALAGAVSARTGG